MQQGQQQPKPPGLCSREALGVSRTSCSNTVDWQAAAAEAPREAPLLPLLLLLLLLLLVLVLLLLPLLLPALTLIRAVAVPEMDRYVREPGPGL